MSEYSEIERLEKIKKLEKRKHELIEAIKKTEITDKNNVAENNRLFMAKSPDFLFPLY